MAVMKYFSERKNSPSMGLMLTSDEETGGLSTAKLLNEEGFNADFCIINEGRHNYDLVVREKGLMVVRLHYKAKSFHSAYPWKGRNVLEDLMQACVKLRKLMPRPRDAWIPTVSVTSLNVLSGQEMNTIPGEVEAILFFRLIKSKKWGRGNIMALLKKLAPEAEIQEVLYGDVFQTDETNVRVKLLKNVAQEVTGKRMRFGENHGASDARYFALKQVPTVVLGPMGKDHHTHDECVFISSVETHFEVLRRFIEEEAKIFASATKMLAKKQ
jgi:acetylornithine deacetylase/succinyl-diaminopimelate desuccinylase-like protein